MHLTDEQTRKALLAAGWRLYEGDCHINYWTHEGDPIPTNTAEALADPITTVALFKLLLKPRGVDRQGKLLAFGPVVTFQQDDDDNRGALATSVKHVTQRPFYTNTAEFEEAVISAWLAMEGD